MRRIEDRHQRDSRARHLRNAKRVPAAARAEHSDIRGYTDDARETQDHRAVPLCAYDLVPEPRHGALLEAERTHTTCTREQLISGHE